MNICLQMVAASVLMNAEARHHAQFLKKPRAVERFMCVFTHDLQLKHLSTDGGLGRTLSYKQHTALPDGLTLVLTASCSGIDDILS